LKGQGWKGVITGLIIFVGGAIPGGIASLRGMFDVCGFLYAVFSVCGAQISSVGGPKAKLNAPLNAAT
jgi:hypothetical protein